MTGMLDVICIDDDVPRPLKRPRSLQPLLKSHPNLSEDERLALRLQAAEDEMARLADARLARLLQAQLDEASQDAATASQEAMDSCQARLLQARLDAEEVSRDEASRFKVPGDVAPAQLQKSLDTSGSRAIAVKVYTSDAASVVLYLEPNVNLISIFSQQPVAKALRGHRGVGRLSATKLSEHFEISRPAPNAKVFDRSLAERTRLGDVFGPQGGVLRLCARSDALLKRGHDGGRGGGGGGAASALARPPVGCDGAGAPGECDRIEVLRLRTPDGGLGSPVVLVKNLNRDRGALLARLTGLQEMVEMAPDARKKINDNVRDELDAHTKTRRNFTSEVRRASDRVLDLGAEAVRADVAASAALAHRTEYASTAVLVYERGSALPRHVDGCGHWVVLLSFGLTVDFYAGDRSFKFESGDALVFNGSTPHGVLHGIDRLHKAATLRGRKAELPDELSYMRDKRASFQARQADA